MSKPVRKFDPSGLVALLRVDEVFEDLDAPLPWWRLGFDGKALLEAGAFTYLPAALFA